MRTHRGSRRRRLALVLLVSACGASGSPEDSGIRPASDEPGAGEAALVEVVGPLRLLPRVRVRRESAGPGGGALRVTWTDVATEPLLRIATPRDASTALVASSTEALAWPVFTALRAGDRARVHVEPLSEVRLDLPGPFRAAGAVAPEVLVLVDRTEPPAGCAARVEALDLLAGVGRFGEVAARNGEVVLRAMPPVPCHVHLRSGAAVAWARWDGRSEVLEVEQRRRTFAEEPLFDGSPLPPDGIVAPGRLDVVAAGALSGAAARRFAGSFRRRGAAPWTSTDLPEAPVYTLRHPQRGVAHVVPGAAGRLDGTSHAGEVVLVAPGGAEMTGHAAAWPCWPGDRRSFTRPADTGLRHRFRATRAARLAGLPPGTYRIDYGFAPGDAEPGPELRRAEVVLTDAAPRATVVVALDVSGAGGPRDR